MMSGAAKALADQIVGGRFSDSEVSLSHWP